MIQILLFGRLKFEFGKQDIAVPVFEPMTTGAFRSWLEAQTELSEILVPGHYLIAVNQTVANDSDVINPDDEIALFPPVTGG